jgi:hypothetical protein
MGIIICILGWFISFMLFMLLWFVMFILADEKESKKQNVIYNGQVKGGGYQPIHDTTLRDIKHESLMEQEKSLILVGKKINEGMSTGLIVSISEHEIEIRQDIKHKHISISIGDEKPVFLNKQQVDELIKFIS